MAVRNIFEGKDQGNSQDPPSLSPGGVDLVERVVRAKERMAEIDMVREGLGGNRQEPRPAESPFKINADLNLGQIITESQKTANDIMGRFMTLMTDEQKTRIGQLEQNLEAIRQALANPPQNQGNQQTPITLLTQLRELRTFMAEVSGDLSKNHEAQPPRSVSELPLLLELEKIKLEGADRQRKWESEKEDRKHQHEWDMKKWEDEKARDDRRWNLEFSMKREQVDKEHKMRSGALETLQDLLGAWGKSVDGAMGEEGTAAAAETPTAGFTCPECKTDISVDPKLSVGEKVTCPKCETVYVNEGKKT